MSGTKAGGKAAAATKKERYGHDYYKKIGSMSAVGWRAGGCKPRGFSLDKQRASSAGRIGGKISRRSTKRSTT